MEFLIKASQLIMSLSILVVLHELGHFIPAKLFKTRVEKFYLFFDPWFSLVKKKIGDTEYGIGWLPLGGYVKISGMIDESMDKEQMQKPAESWEFRAKPTWQRLIIMLGGVTVNLLLGIFIYAMVLFAYGSKYLPNDNLTDGIWCVSPLAKDLGFETGDKIIAVDENKPLGFNGVFESLLYAESVTLERDGVTKELALPSNFIAQLLESEERRLFAPRIPTVISGFTTNSNAKNAGFKKKDRIVSVNGVQTKYFDEFKFELQQNKGENISVGINRFGKEILLSVDVTNEGMIGFMPSNLSLNQLEELEIYSLNSATYSFLESLPAGYHLAIKKLGSYINQFKLILSPSTGAYKGLGGFGTIGSLFPGKWHWQSFWEMTAFLSLMLAFMNILPIPALDGGHVMFLLYEMLVGKPAPEKIMEYAQMVGMILLLSLLVYANGNDLMKLF
jgi:regulator of sigma E protease|tara:strand:- start:2742 stop:4079 length:1338 start_codon:yes stop_codon:yes gene_type:complete